MSNTKWWIQATRGAEKTKSEESVDVLCFFEYIGIMRNVLPYGPDVRPLVGVGWFVSPLVDLSVIIS